jgi:hypothetical protein
VAAIAVARRNVTSHAKESPGFRFGIQSFPSWDFAVHPRNMLAEIC